MEEELWARLPTLWALLSCPCLLHRAVLSLELLAAGAGETMAVLLRGDWLCMQVFCFLLNAKG